MGIGRQCNAWRAARGPFVEPIGMITGQSDAHQQAGMVVMQLDRAAVRLDQGAGHAEAESGPPARPAGCESNEGLEDAIPLTGGNARAGIGDLDYRGAPVTVCAHLDGHRGVCMGQGVV